MTLIYRSQKGAPLTIAEMDGNFQELADRLEKLEQTPPDAEGIASVTVENGALFLQGTHGTTFGPIIIPKLCWNPRGGWGPKQTYYPLDVVYHQYGLYVCQVLHTSTEAFDIQHWALLFPLSELGQGDQAVATSEALEGPSAEKSHRLPNVTRQTFPNNPAIGAIVLLIDAPEKPDLFYWEGNTWNRVRDGQSLESLI